MQIIYANKTAQVPANMEWPDWVCDIPQPDSEIAAGAPICTVLAQARTAKLAFKTLMQRAAQL
jgi:predicted ATP-grasp superfamily ATP-dependent carboligase